MEELDFDSDTFEDIVAKDGRYNGRAYTLLMDVVHYLGKDGGRFGAEDIMYEFRETALDQFGPLAYRVLTEWGLKSCEDLGEMMFNLAEFHRVERNEEDTLEAFVGGYDFEEAFLGPYQT